MTICTNREKDLSGGMGLVKIIMTNVIIINFLPTIVWMWALIYIVLKEGRMGIWNISIYNVYSRMNPILVYKGDVKEEAGSDDYGNPNVTYRNAFKSIGIFPIIPSVSYTYKF